jgi:hypothetical protein
MDIYQSAKILQQNKHLGLSVWVVMDSDGCWWIEGKENAEDRPIFSYDHVEAEQAASTYQLKVSNQFGTLKALSGTECWFTAMLKFGKDIENRSWKSSFRGTIALHAAKGMPRSEYEKSKEYIERITGRAAPRPDELKLQSIIGLIDIVDCVTSSKSPWFFGPYGFVVRNPVVLPEPIPCSGALSFWLLPLSVEEQIRQQLKDHKFTLPKSNQSRLF